MGANKYENFEIKVINRSDIHEADYNPRKISDNSLKKLKKWFATEGKGQLAPLVVNKNTMTLVSGHQRLKCLDQLNRKNDYDLTVSLVDLDEKTEVEANVFMNNPSAQGEFDYDILAELKDNFPDVSFTDGFGFDESEINALFNFDEDIKIDVGNSEEANEVVTSAKDFINASKTARENIKSERDDFYDTFKENRKQGMENSIKYQDEHGSPEMWRDDYTITIVCSSNSEKHEIMRKLNKKETEKYLKSSVLYDIYDHKYELRSV